MQVRLRQIPAGTSGTTVWAPEAAFFFENGTDLFCVIGQDGNFERVNPAWESATGWDCDDLCGQPVASLLHPDDRAAFAAHLAEPDDQTASASLECRLRARDGGYRLVEWRIARARAEGAAHYAVARDITEVQRRTDQVETLERATGVGTWEIDLQTRRTHWSPELFRLHGLPVESKPHKLSSMLRFYPEPVRPQIKAALRALIRNGTPFDLETPFRDANGRQFHVRTVGFARMQGGKPVSVLGTMSDATEARVRRSWLERLSAVVETTTNGVALLDKELCVEWVNPAFEKMSGLRLEDIKGKSVDVNLSHDQPALEQIKSIHNRLLQNGSVRAEVYKLRPDGTAYWIDVAIEAMRDCTGAVTGYIAVETDITEAKEYARRLETLERSARAAHERLVAAVEALPDAFVLFDSDDRLVLCNDKYCEFYPLAEPALKPGVPFEVIEKFALEKGQLSVAPGDEDAWLAKRLAGRAAGGETLVQHLPDGRVLRTVERRTASGELVAFHTDITELSLKERAATAARNALQATLDAMPDLLFEVDINGIFHDARDGTSSRLQHPDEWYLGRSIYDTLPVRSADRIMAAMQELMAKDSGAGLSPMKPFDIDDDHRWFGVCLALKRTEASTPHFIIVARDITERKRAEDERARNAAELAAANERLEHALAERDAAEDRFFDIAGISHDWFWEQDGDQRFTYVSESLRQIGQISPADHIGRTREEITQHPDDPELQKALEQIRASIDRREPFKDIVYRLAQLRDRTIWVRVSGAPVYDARGKFLGYRGVGSNVTDLLEARLRAEEASASKSRFLANMSHEIRTPLNGIMGMATLLHDKIADSEQRDLVTIIRDSGEALSTILNDILDFSKIEAGLLDLSVADFVPADLGRKVESLHRLKATEKGLRFAVRTSPDAFVSRRGDEHRILQVLHNLVSNAIKFTEHGSVSVTFSGRAEGPLELTVRDTGIGLSPDQKARIFDEFVQADSSISRRYGGTGLGLSITRRLVQLMDGTIRIDTTEGRGTTVRVSLPLAAAGATRNNAQGPAAAPALPAGLVALVADDNATNRLLMDKFLERLGVQAEIVSGGAAAVAAARARAFDLLLLDISMPDMTGPEALAEIRAHEASLGRPPTPAVAVTANAMHHQVVEYLEGGFARHVGKPIRIEELASAIQAALDATESARTAGTQAP